MSPRRLWNALTSRFVQSSLWRFIVRCCVRWPVLADLYFFVSGGFRREHRAALSGILAHLNDMDVKTASGAEYTLTRNIHRLEKGLIMRPRRSVFAKDYIGETVDVFIELSNNQDKHGQLLNWAFCVLTKFFEVTGDEKVLNKHRTLFQKQTAFAPSDSAELLPYCRSTEPLSINYESLLELAWRRRSVRWYQNKPVPRDLIDQAIDVAKLSPSACNRQPFEFRVFDDPDLAQTIGAIPMGTVGFSQNFPCLIVIVGDLRAYVHVRDRHVIYVDGGLAAMALQFAFEVQGISTCCINWPDIEPREREMAQAIGLKPHLRPIMCMSLGYADPEGMVPYSQKKTLDQIRSYNQTC